MTWWDEQWAKRCVECGKATAVRTRDRVCVDCVLGEQLSKVVMQFVCYRESMLDRALGLEVLGSWMRVSVNARIRLDRKPNEWNRDKTPFLLTR